MGKRSQHIGRLVLVQLSSRGNSAQAEGGAKALRLVLSTRISSGLSTTARAAASRPAPRQSWTGLGLADGGLKTETLTLPENWEALANLNGQWIDRFHDRKGLKYILLDMDRSVSPTHDDQEGSAWKGRCDCTRYHPNFLFNQFGMLERCALRHGNVHSADNWRDVLDPERRRRAGSTPLA